MKKRSKEREDNKTSSLCSSLPPFNDLQFSHRSGWEPGNTVVTCTCHCTFSLLNTIALTSLPLYNCTQGNQERPNDLHECESEWGRKIVKREF